MLRQGGNAVDAALAAAFASYVAESAISTLGGGGFALLKQPGKRPVLYDFFVTVPGQGRDGQPTEMDFTPIPVRYEAATHTYYAGRASSGVPGNVAGLCALAEDAGALPLATILEPAIDLARDGYEVSPLQAYAIALVSPILTYEESSRRYFKKADGDLLQVGDPFANPELAQSLEIIAQQGADAFYKGTLAEEIVADHASKGGLITAEDLASYEVVRREPLAFRYRGLDIVTNPPPSIGGILIAHSMRLLDRFEISQMGWGSPGHLTLLGEIFRETVEARLQDAPQKLAAPSDWNAWLDDSRLDHAWRNVQAALEEGPGSWAGREPHSSPSTTHVSALDEDGNAVSLSTTPGETGGYTIGGTGISMNNVLGEEDVNPEGFHKDPPGLRLSSMMAPSLVLRGDEPSIVAGTGGSSRIRTAIVQLLSNVIDWKLPLEDAVDRPRVHWEEGILHLEGGTAAAVADALEDRGYKLVRWDGLSIYFGGTHIAVGHADGRMEGAGDPRRGGSVASVTGV